MHSTMFYSFSQQVDIVLTKDDICTLVNVVIFNSIQMDLIFRFCVIQRFVTSDATQAKEKNYRDRHPINQFLDIYTNRLTCFHTIVPMPFGA